MNNNDMFIDGIHALVSQRVNESITAQGGFRLGDLIDALAQQKQDLPLLVNGEGMGDVDSYRGYYDHLAIESSPDFGTVAEGLKKLRAANGQTFQGYKGGDYRMNAGTPMWASNYGECSGLMVTSVSERDGAVHIGVTEEEW